MTALNDPLSTCGRISKAASFVATIITVRSLFVLPLELLAGLSIAILLSVLTFRVPEFLTFLTIWFCACATLWSGALALRMAGAPGSLLLSIIVGAALTSHIVLLAVIGLKVPAGTATLCWSVPIAIATAVTRGGERRAGVPTELALLIICCAIAVAWAWPTASSGNLMRSTAYFPAWSDYFIHAGEIASLMDGPAFGRGLVELVDVPKPLYHFASYVLAAAGAGSLNLSPLEAAISSWIGLSFLLIFAGVAVLSTTLSGRVAAILALGLIAAFPDASHYGLKNGFLSFHWLLVTSPGSGYAIGISLSSIAVLIVWLRTSQPGLLILSVLLAAAVFMFRAHVFLLLAPLWFCIFFITSRFRFCAIPAIGIVATLAVLVSVIGCDLCLRSGYDPAVARYFNFLHANARAFVEPGIFSMMADTRLGRSSLGELIFLLIGAFGYMLAGYIAFLAITARQPQQHRSIMFLPAILIGIFVAVTVLAPVPSHGDFTDLKQRGFVFVYTVLAIWTAMGIATFVKGLRSPLLASALVMLFAIGSIAVPARFASALSAPSFAWSKNFYNSEIDLATIRVADFLRSEASHTDVMAIARPDPAEMLTEDITQMSALSGIPVYISRAGVLSVQNPQISRIVKDRLTDLNRINQESVTTVALRDIQRLGIRWFIVDAKQSPPNWVAEDTPPAFRAGKWLVYKARP